MSVGINDIPDVDLSSFTGSSARPQPVSAPGTVPGAGGSFSADDLAPWATNPFGYERPPPGQEKPKPGEDATWDDWYRYVKHGTGALISGSIGAASEYLNKPVFGDTGPVPTGTAAQAVKQYGREVSAAALKEMSPAARERLTKDLFESDDFFGSLAAKGISGAVSMLPTVIATTASVVGSGGAALPLVLAGAIGAIQTAGGTYDDLQQAVDAIPQEQLLTNSAEYKRLLASGMDEKGAKAKLAQDFAGIGPAVAGLVTALTMKFGVEGAIAQRFATGMVVRGILGRGVAGAAGEGLQETVETFSQSLAVEQSLVDSGAQKAINWGKVWKETVEGGVVGAAIGGPANVVLGGGEHAQPPNPVPPGGAGQSPSPTPPGPAPGPVGVPPNPAGGLGAPPIQPAANPPGAAAAQSGAPTPGKQPAPAGGAAAATPGVSVVSPGTIDPSLAAASAEPTVEGDQDEEQELQRQGRGRHDPAIDAVFAADYVAPKVEPSPPGAPAGMPEPGPTPGAAVNQPPPPQAAPVQPAPPPQAAPAASEAAPTPAPVATDTAPVVERLSSQIANGLANVTEGQRFPNPELRQRVAREAADQLVARGQPATPEEALSLASMAYDTYAGQTPRPASAKATSRARQGAELKSQPTPKGAGSKTRPKRVVVEAASPSLMTPEPSPPPISEAPAPAVSPEATPQGPAPAAPEPAATKIPGAKGKAAKAVDAFRRRAEVAAVTRAANKARRGRYRADAVQARAERLLDDVMLPPETMEDEGGPGFPDAELRQQAARRAAAEVDPTVSDRELFDAARRHYAELEHAATTPAPEVVAEKEVAALERHEEGVRAEKVAEPKKRSRATKAKPRDVEDIAVESERTAIERAEKLIAEKGEAAPQWAFEYREAGKAGREKPRGWKTRRAVMMQRARAGELAERQAQAAPKPTREERVAQRAETIAKPAEQRIKEAVAAERAEKMAAPARADLERAAENVFKTAPALDIKTDTPAQSLLGWAATLPKRIINKAPLVLRADRGPYTRFMTLARLALNNPNSRRKTDDLAAGYVLLSGSPEAFNDIFSKADDAADMKASTTQYQMDNITSADLSETQDIGKATKRSAKRGSTRRPSRAQIKAVQPRDDNTLVHAKTGETVSVADENIRTVADMLDRHPLGRTSNPLIQKIREYVDSFLRTHYGDVRVYVLSGAEIDRLIGPGGERTYGFWSPPSRSAAAAGSPGIVAINRDVFAAHKLMQWQRDPDFGGETLRHEMLHLVTGMALNDNTLGFGDTVRSILRESRNAYAKRFGEDRANAVQGFVDEHEFLADALAAVEFQEILDGIPVSTALRQEIEATTGHQSQWWRLIDKILDLFRLNRRRDVMNAFEAVIRTGQHLMATPRQQAQRALDWDPTINPNWTPGMAMSKEDFDAVQQLATDLGVRPGVAWGILRSKNLDEYLSRADYTGGSPQEAVAEFFTDTVRRSQLRSDLRATRTNAPLKWFRRWLGANTMWDIGRISREMGLFRAGTTGETVIDRLDVAMARLDQAHVTLKQEGHELVNDLRDFNARLQNAGRLDQFNNLIFDSTRFGLTATGGLASNPHVDPNDPAFGQRWAQLARLHQIYASLPGDEQAMYDRLRKFFTDAQNDYVTDLLGSQLEDWETRGRAAPRAYPPGESRASIVAWARSGDINRTGKARTPRDSALHLALGAHAKQLRAAVNLSKIEGFYFPLLRDDGEFILYGRADVQPPPGGVILPESVPRERQNRNLIYFKNESDADAYVASLGLENDMPATKHTWYRDITGQSVPKATPGAQAFTVVEVNNQYFETFQTEQQALDALTELRSSGQFGNNGRISNVNLKRDVFNGHSELLPRQLNTLINGIEQMQGVSPTLKAQHKNALVQAAAKSLRGVKVQHRRLPRRNVAGFSMNTEDATERYIVSMANSRATLRHGGEVDQRLREAAREVADREYEGAPMDNLRRQAMLGVVQGKVENAEYDQSVTPLTRALVRFGFLKFLGGPHFMITNATQLLMGWNEIAARTGAGHGASLAEMTKALKEMRAIGLLIRGAKGYVDIRGALAKRQPRFLDYVRQGLGRAPDAANIIDMIDDFAGLGIIGSDVQVLESQLAGRRPPPPGFLRGVKIGGSRAFDFAEHLMKQGPIAVELMNRIAPAVAAYRMSRRGGKDHKQAKVIARDVLTKSQFDYRAFNMPGKFASAAFGWKAVTMFKKFPLNMGLYLGHYLIDSIKGQRGGTTLGRVRAVKMLMGLFAMTWLMAGAEGALPWEPLQALLFGISKAAQLAGIDTGYRSWDDFVFESGQKWGDLFVHGPLRELLGIDISGSVGLDTLISFDKPKEDNAEAYWAYIGRFYGGPLAAAGMDIGWGLASLVNGVINGDTNEMLRGAEKLMPVKWGQQMTRAVRLSQYGEKSAEGKQYTEPMGTYGTALRAGFGLKPASESKEQEASFYLRRQETDVRERRTKLMGRVARAIDERDEGMRAKAMSAIRDWNAAHPKDRIDSTDIQRSVATRRRTDRERKKKVKELLQ